jgi:hypothetical protein
VSFLKSLFGLGGAKEAAAPVPGKEIEHKGFVVRAEPMPAGGQYQVAGWIEKRFGEELKRHHFIRADLAASVDEASDTALQKGRRIVDEQGDRLFG